MNATLDLIPARPEHATELAAICFDAFGTLHARHNTPRDFDSPQAAAGMMAMFTSHPQIAGFAAKLGGKLVGSNFIVFMDEVAGVGPITVDPSCQAKGVGRALMRAVMAEAERRQIRHVRLLQEAINTTSLSLYTSLGFRWRESVAILEAAGSGGRGVRAMTTRDLDTVDTLCREKYGHSRRNEIAGALAAGMPALVRERNGNISGYLLPGFVGHGCGESVEDMGELVSHAGATAPPGFKRVFAPLGEAGLFEELLRRGCRTVKVMSYMTMGPYARGQGVWMPSILN